MAKKNSGKNFIVRGGSFSFCFLIALLLPPIASIYLTSLWGNLGNSIFYGSYWFFMGLYIISGLCVPLVLGRLIKSRIIRNAIKDSRSMQRRAFLYCFIFSTVFSLFLFFFSGFISNKIIKEPLSELPLMLFAFVLALGTLCCYLRGYFVGHGALLLLGVSFIIEQVTGIALGIIFGNLFSRRGEYVAALLRNPDYTTSFRVAGFVAGLGVGYIITLLFLFIIYIATHGFFRRAFGKDAGYLREDSLTGSYSFLTSLLPFLAIMLMTLGGMFFDQLIFKLLSPGSSEVSSVLALSSSFGIYAGKYRVLFILPLIIAFVMCRVPAQTMARQPLSQDGKKRRALTGDSLKTIVLFVTSISLILGFAGVIFVNLFYGGKDAAVLVSMLRPGMISCIFFGAAMLLYMLLWEDGRRLSCLFGVFVSFVARTALVFVFVRLLDLGLLSFAIGDLVFSICLLAMALFFSNTASLLRRGLSREFIPVLAGAAAEFILVFILSLVFGKLSAGSMATGIISLCVTSLLGLLVFYFVVLIMRGAGAKVLSGIPGGGVILALNRFR